MTDFVGKRILITRPRDQYEEFAEKLSELGAIPLSFPTIFIAPVEKTLDLDQALSNLESYAWVVLTSVNGVKVVWDRMVELGMMGFPKNLKVAAIGPKTAGALVERGVKVSFVPSEYIAEAILPGLGDVKGQRILLLRADIARPDLADAIQKAEGFAQEVPVYHTIQGVPNVSEWAEFEKGVDVITFTSASTVLNFLALLKDRYADFHNYLWSSHIACIGPIAARAARQNNLRVDIVASEYTIEGLISAIKEFYRNQQKDIKINE